MLFSENMNMLNMESNEILKFPDRLGLPVLFGSENI